MKTPGIRSISRTPHTRLAAETDNMTTRTRPQHLPEAPLGTRAPPLKILFLHGSKSVAASTQPAFLAQHGHEVVNPALSEEDFDEDVRIAQAAFDRHQPDFVVGWSRGAAVAMNIHSGKSHLVLLCPAWKKYGTATAVKPNAVILHSRADDVVPFADSEELAGSSGLPTSALIDVGTDHLLADPQSLSAMLRECRVITHH